MVTLPWVHVLHYNVTSIILHVHTDVFMNVYWYSINSVTNMVAAVITKFFLFNSFFSSKTFA